jgi:cbb3-type cytochrome oxidase subunit 3
MFADFLVWIMDLGHSKMVALLIFFTTFIGILIYVYSDKKRGERLESYRYLPFLDDDDSEKPVETSQTKGEK